MLIKCIDNTELERYGFLWLKKRRKPIDGLTTGKIYNTIKTEIVDYGNIYVPCRFGSTAILNDNDRMRIYTLDKFEVYIDSIDFWIPAKDYFNLR